jgi:hypothetical protein
LRLLQQPLTATKTRLPLYETRVPIGTEFGAQSIPAALKTYMLAGTIDDKSIVPRMLLSGRNSKSEKKKKIPRSLLTA